MSQSTVVYCTLCVQLWCRVTLPLDTAVPSTQGELCSQALHSQVGLASFKIPENLSFCDSGPRRSNCGMYCEASHDMLREATHTCHMRPIVAKCLRPVVAYCVKRCDMSCDASRGMSCESRCGMLCEASCGILCQASCGISFEASRGMV